MLPLLLIVVLVLLFVISIYLKVHDISIRSVIISAVKCILVIDVILSVCISVFIVASEVAFSCDVRYIDFLINVSNAIYFSILLGYLASRVITSPRLTYFTVKNVIPSFLMIVQVILAGMAHFANVKEKGEKVSVDFCYDERRSALVVSSYCYGFALLVLCIVLTILKLYRTQGCYRRSGKIEMFCIVFMSISVAVIYLVSLFFVLWPKDETDCGRHAESLVVLALFPAIISLLGFSCSIIKPVYKKLRRFCGVRAEARTFL